MKRISLDALKVKSFVPGDLPAMSQTVKGGSVGYHTHVNHHCSDAACYSEYCQTIRTCPGYCGSVPL